MKGRWLGEILIALFLGVFLGLGSVYSGPNLPLSLTAAALIAIIIGYSLKNIPEGDNSFLQKAFLFNVIARMGLAIFLSFVIEDPGVLAGDGGGYEKVGKVFARFWRHELEGVPIQLQEYIDRLGLQGTYVYWNAVLFYLFGDVGLLPTLLNAIFGTLVTIYLYRIAYRLYGEKVARITLILSSIMPSMILWSALNLRDAPATLAITAAIYYTIKLKEHFSTKDFLALAFAMLSVAALRSYMFFILSAALVLSFIGFKKGKELQTILIGILLSGLLFYLFTSLGLGESSQVQNASFEQLNAMRRGLATGGSAYEVGADISTPGKALAFLPIGILYLLFAPFPWQLTSFRQLLAFPEVLAFYFLVPAIIRGVRFTIREKLGQSLPILLTATLVTISYALVEGNVGTAYRHKSQILGLFFLMAAIDLAQSTRKKHGLSNTESIP